MKKLHAKRQRFRAPQCVLVAKFDFAILVVIQFVLAQKIRQVRARGVEGLMRPLFGPRGDIIQRDLGGFIGRQPASRQCSATVIIFGAVAPSM